MLGREPTHSRLAAQALREAAPSSLPRLLALAADDDAASLDLSHPRKHVGSRPSI
jgi:hypothetical protein